MIKTLWKRVTWVDSTKRGGGYTVSRKSQGRGHQKLYKIALYHREDRIEGRNLFLEGYLSLVHIEYSNKGDRVLSGTVHRL